MSTDLHFSPMDPDFIADPYPFYRRLREAGGVHYEPVIDSWLIGRYSDVATLMGDPRLITGSQRETTYARLSDEAVEPMRKYIAQLKRFILLTNPPLHTRLRRVFGRTFSPARLETMRPSARRHAHVLVETLVNSGHADMVSDFAYPLVCGVLVDLMGLPQADIADICGLAAEIFTITGGVTYSADPVGAVERLNVAATTLLQYMCDEIAQRRRSPREDMLSALIAAGDEVGKLSDEDLAANAGLFFSAGLPKTVCHLTNAVLALLRHPEQWRQLAAADDALVVSAADELVRYDTPVQIAVPQVAAAAIEVGEHRINPGQGVHLVLASANRDPARFTDPDRLDLRRPPGRHIGFGVGLHNCLGAALARVHGQEVLPLLARRVPNMRLVDAAARPTYRPMPHVRALASLPVVTGGGRRLADDIDSANVGETVMPLAS